MRPGFEALLLNARLVLEVILDATAALWKNCRRCGLHTNCNKCDLIHDLYKVPQVPPVSMRVSGYLCLHRSLNSLPDFPTSRSLKRLAEANHAVELKAQRSTNSTARRLGLGPTRPTHPAMPHLVTSPQIL